MFLHHFQKFSYLRATKSLIPINNKINFVLYFKNVPHKTIFAYATGCTINMYNFFSALRLLGNYLQKK